MAELRWILLGLGLVVVAAIYLYTRFKPRVDRGIQATSPRREPILRDQDLPTANADVFHDPADLVEKESEPPVLTELPEPAEAKIVAIRLMSRDSSGFPAEKLILTMRDLGLRHGDFGIFHRCIDDASNDFSVASLVEPGSFDLTRIKIDTYPGVSIFMRLPGNRDGVEIFDDMLDTSRSLAKQMDGELLDEQGSSLSIQRERYLREEVIQFEHQGIS